MTSLNIASLPGVGKLEDPEPRHYREALDWLDHQEPKLDIRNSPYVDRYIHSHRNRLARTIRRLEWKAKGIEWKLEVPSFTKGWRVRLSRHGMERLRQSQRWGIVAATPRAGSPIVSVLWNGLKQPQAYHQSFVELA